MLYIIKTAPVQQRKISRQFIPIGTVWPKWVNINVMQLQFTNMCPSQIPMVNHSKLFSKCAIPIENLLHQKHKVTSTFGEKR